MNPPDSRILVLAAAMLAAPAFGAVPAKAPAAKSRAAKTPVPATPADPAGDLIAQAHAAQAGGNNDLAVRLAQSAIVADPARPASYDALGDVYAAAGEADYARDSYTQALAIDPSDPAALKAVAALDHPSDQHAANTKASSGP